MDFIAVIEIIVAVIIVILLKPYLTYVLNLINTFLPKQILIFITLAITISIVQYFISKKDD